MPARQRAFCFKCSFSLAQLSLNFFHQADLNAHKKEMSREEIVAALKQCAIFRGDYMECLHGDKAFARSAALANAQKVGAEHSH